MLNSKSLVRSLLTASFIGTAIISPKTIAETKETTTQKPVWEMTEEERAEYRARVILQGNPNSLIHKKDSQSEIDERAKKSGQYNEDFLKKHTEPKAETKVLPAATPTATQEKKTIAVKEKSTLKTAQAKPTNKAELVKQTYGLSQDVLKNQLGVIRLWDFQSWNQIEGKSDWWTYDVMGNSHARAVGLARPSICFDRKNKSDYNRVLQIDNGANFNPYLLTQESQVTQPDLQLKFKQGEDFTIGGWVKYVNDPISGANGVSILSKAPVNGQGAKNTEWVWYMSGNVVGFNFNRVFTGDKYYYDDLEMNAGQSGEATVSQRSKKPIDQQPPTTPIKPPVGSIGGMTPGTIFKQHLVEYDMKGAPLNWWAHTLGNCYINGVHNQCWVFVSMSFKFSDRNNPHALLTFMRQPLGAYEKDLGDFSFTQSRKTVILKLDKTQSAQPPYHSDNPVRIGASTRASFNGNLKGLFVAKKFLNELDVTQIARAYQPGQNFECEYKDIRSEINYNKNQ